MKAESVTEMKRELVSGQGAFYFHFSVFAVSPLILYY